MISKFFSESLLSSVHPHSTGGAYIPCSLHLTVLKCILFELAQFDCQVFIFILPCFVWFASSFPTELFLKLQCVFKTERIKFILSTCSKGCAWIKIHGSKLNFPPKHQAPKAPGFTLDQNCIALGRSYLQDYSCYWCTTLFNKWKCLSFVLGVFS